MIKNDLIKNILKGVLCFFLFFESIWIQRFIVYIFNIKDITPVVATILSFVSSTIFCIFIVLFYRKELIKEWKVFKNSLSDNLSCGIKYWLFGLVVMVTSNILINLLFNTGQANNEQSVQQMIKAYPLIMLINAGIIAPINEEILFRKCFKNIFSKNLIFILTSGIVFGLLHVTSATNLEQMLYIIPYGSLGIAFAIMYCKTNSIYTSMFIHMFHNLSLILLSINALGL